jgi:hypothetical protein
MSRIRPGKHERAEVMQLGFPDMHERHAANSC